MVLLDIMQNDRFICQLRYNRRGFPIMIGGKVSESFDYGDLEKFVYEQRPSLKGKNIQIIPAKQATYAH